MEKRSHPDHKDNILALRMSSPLVPTSLDGVYISIYTVADEERVICLPAHDREQVRIFYETFATDNTRF